MSFRRFSLGSILALLLTAVVAAGCSLTAPEPEFPELTYRHLAPLELAAGRIEITTRYIPPMKEPNVDHRSPVTLHAALRRWAGDRLRAAGGRPIAHLVILDASIREVPLKVTGGVAGFFTTDQSARYDGRAAVRLEIRDPGGRQIAFATARATRSLHVAEDSSIADRERVLFALTEDLVSDINARFEAEARRHLGAHLINPQR
ncbi:MAG: hypothetical protein OEO83_11275 [Alphaproteobacteria bacterium]|nr:hypothetical protein [Alphaproteobacteria bacterium]